MQLSPQQGPVRQAEGGGKDERSSMSSGEADPGAVTGTCEGDSRKSRGWLGVISADECFHVLKEWYEAALEYSLPRPALLSSTEWCTTEYRAAAAIARTGSTAAARSVPAHYILCPLTSNLTSIGPFVESLHSCRAAFTLACCSLSTLQQQRTALLLPHTRPARRCFAPHLTPWLGWLASACQHTCAKLAGREEEGVERQRRSRRGAQ